MDFTCIQVLEIKPDEALRRLKLVLQREGFVQTTDVDIAGLLSRAEDGDIEFCTLVNAYDPKLVRRTLDVAREAALLPATSFLVREYDGGSLVEAVDPQLVAVVPGRPELQPVAEDGFSVSWPRRPSPPRPKAEPRLRRRPRAVTCPAKWKSACSGSFFRRLRACLVASRCRTADGSSSWPRPTRQSPR